MAEVAEKAQEVVEVPAPEAAPEAPALPTREDLKAQGWSAAEMDSAEKRGMIKKAEDKTPEAKAPEKAPEKQPEATPKAAEKAPEVKRGTPLDDVVLTPEQQKFFEENFPPGNPVRAFYFRAINERKGRQRAEQERDALKKALADAETKLSAPKQEQEGEDPEDKVLTVKEMKALLAEKDKEISEKQSKNHERARLVTTAQVEQEEYAKSIIPDFDDTVKLAAEVMQNMDAVLPEKWQQAKAVKLMRELQIAAANADQLGLDDYNAAMIAVELGRMHPKYGKTTEKEEKPGAKTDPKANGGRTPEEMERMKRNAEQRPSSASVPQGGGKRAVSADEVTADDLNRMNAAERLSFRQKHPERYRAILQG